MIYSFKGFTPVVHPSSFIHPQATVTGNVIIGRDVYIGPGAAIRGDWGAIIINDGCNVQENCTLHMFPGKEVVLEEEAHIGHGAVIHGARIGKNVLIGMNSVIMDDVVIGENCIVGAMSFIKAGEQLGPNLLLAGNPARIIRELNEEMIEWKRKGTRLYQSLPKDCHEYLIETEALTEIPENRPPQESLYETWNVIKSKK
jgi:phenylacetic acid degradation protein